MRTYVLKRLLLVFPTMIGITLISFIVIQLAPGDPAEMKVSPGAGGQQEGDKSQSRENYEKTLAQFDLDKPKTMQYLRWLGKLCGLKVEVQGAKQSYKDAVTKMLLEKFELHAKKTIDAKEASLKKEIKAGWSARKVKKEGETPDSVAAKQLSDWKSAQAQKRRYKYSKEINALRKEFLEKYDQDFGPGLQGKVKGWFYAQWYGEGFEGHFDYVGLSINKTTSGNFYPLDFGRSFKTDREVLAVLAEKLPVSMELSLLSIFLAYIIAIPLGIHSSVSQGTFMDQVITTILFVLYSLPSFWVAIMLLLLVSKGGHSFSPEEIKVFPVAGIPPLWGDTTSLLKVLGAATAGVFSGALLVLIASVAIRKKAPNLFLVTVGMLLGAVAGITLVTQLGGIKNPSWMYVWDHIQHLALPVFCLTYASFAYISRQMRAGMMDVIRSDYIRTARAKGLSERVVIFKHALRNSLIPILTIVAVILPAMVGGSVIIETIFNIDGIGKESFDAILKRDYPIVMAIFTLSAFLTLIGILVSDLLYAVVDPQISFEGQ